jgi:hypothetical protein
VTLRSRTGKKLADFKPTSEPVKLAVTSRMVAALVKADGRWQIEVLAPVHRLVPLAHRPTAMTASGSTLLLSVDRTIYLLAARSGPPRVIARAAARPLGLSIAGRRVAWAENLRRRGTRIRAFELP